MKRSVHMILLVCLMTGVSVLARTTAQAQAQAQAQPQTPPRVLRIYREDVKPGMAAAHAKVEAGWPKAFAKAGASNHYIAMTSMSGANEAWFVEPHESFAALEKSEADIDKNAGLTADLDRLAAEDSAFLSGGRGWIATYNAELSRPSPDPFPLNRYVSVTIYRVRPGKAPDFTEFRKLLKSVHESEKTTNYFLLYQVTSGAPAGTYLLLRGLKSLTELDPDPARKPFGEVLGESRQKKLNELAASFMIMSEFSLFKLSPGMSYPPKQFLAVDAAFWGPKATASSTKTAARKDVKVKKIASAQ